jgi:D-methionine transport system ATP-binding protein
MIAIEHVGKSYKSADRAALEDVSLTIAAGEVFGIIGRSGAGKSTLIRLINGLEKPSRGRVVVDGEDVGQASADRLRALRRRIGMIFQQFGLLGSRSVADNIAFPLRIAGIGRAARDTRVAELLALVGLTEHGHKYPAQLSGGQKQRVGIARALAGDAKILLCDEATSALDPETTRDILALIARLNREIALTVVLITHEMDVVRQVCDRVAVLHQGRVVETGPVADIFLSPQAAETRAMLAESWDGLEAARLAGFDGRVVEIAWTGATGELPFLTAIGRATGTDIILLDGYVGSLKAGRYGQFTLGLTGGDIDGAVAELTRMGLVNP